MGHPFGFFLFGVKIFVVYRSQFSKLIASSNVNIIICGTWLGSSRPGTNVPSFEQKHSGRVHNDISHASAAFGSLSTSHQPSSDPSGQSTEPSQKYSFGRHVPSPHPNWLLSAHWADSNSGFGTRSSGIKFSSLTYLIIRHGDPVNR